MIRFLLSGCWSADQLFCSWVDSTRLIIPEVESDIESAWVTAGAKPGIHLFDGPMCRLESFSTPGDQLHLNFAPTSYRIFLGTNMAHPDFADRFGPQVMANPLGLSVAVRTVDQQLILGRRNDRVAYYPGRTHPIAGSLEPSDPSPFTAIARELFEELLVRPDEISSMACLGIVQDPQLRQPELILRADVSVPVSSLRDRLDRAEHTSLWTINATAAAVDTAITSDATLTPVAVGALTLWKNSEQSAGN